ncbi:MAG: SusE domain-containing protein [Marinifilaceae bacterium]
MKKIIYSALLAGLTLFSACSEDDNQAVLSTNPEKPEFQIPENGDVFVLDEATGQNKITFKWENANYGVDTEVTYKLQADKDGGDFSEPIELGESTDNFLSIKTEDLNNKLMLAGFPIEEPVTVLLRVTANISSAFEALTTEPIETMFTLYKVEVNYPKLYLPGSYQGWDPANENTVIYSLKSDGVYEGFVNLDNGDGTNVEFKFTDGPSWDVNWGDTGADNTLDPSGDNIILTDPGFYRVEVDVNELTYTLEKYSWGIIGSATPNGWDSDVDFSFDADENALTATMKLVPGEIKFRANDGWDVNLGGSPSELTFGGDNIAFDGEAGTYKIVLNLSVPPYSYTLEKQ